MAHALAKKSADLDENFVPMERTRAQLSRIWEDLLNEFHHTPETARRMIDGALQELHKTDEKLAKKVTSKVKSKIKSKVKKVVSVKKSVDKKLKAKKNALKKKKS